MKYYISIACVITAFLAGWVVNGFRLGEQIAEIKKEHATAVLEAQKKASMKLKEQLMEQEKITNEAIDQKEKALADAVSARDVSRRLRERISALSRAGCPTAVSGSKTTETNRDLCADMFSRIDELSGELAAYADRARIAGMACEKSYDSLR